jgi:DNA polymerase-1
VASTIFSVPVSEVDADMRRAAKVVNFGILYGMGVSAVQKNLGTTREKAAAFYADYFNVFPTISDWLEQTKEYAKKTGYTKTIFGRKRFIQGITSTIPFMRSIAERTATNAPIQGTAADIIKIAIMLVQNKIDAEKLSDKIHLVLQIHDELVYEVHESVVEQAKKSITHAMESVFDHCPLPYEGEAVPLKVSCGVGKRLDEVK